MARPANYSLNQAPVQTVPMQNTIPTAFLDYSVSTLIPIEQDARCQIHHEGLLPPATAAVCQPGPGRRRQGLLQEGVIIILYYTIIIIIIIIILLYYIILLSLSFHYMTITIIISLCYIILSLLSLSLLYYYIQGSTKGG